MQKLPKRLARGSYLGEKETSSPLGQLPGTLTWLPAGLTWKGYVGCFPGRHLEIPAALP